MIKKLFLELSKILKVDHHETLNISKKKDENVSNKDDIRTFYRSKTLTSIFKSWDYFKN